jgi:hypothetical protein
MSTANASLIETTATMEMEAAKNVLLFVGLLMFCGAQVALCRLGQAMGACISLPNVMVDTAGTITNHTNSPVCRQIHDGYLD